MVWLYFLQCLLKYLKADHDVLALYQVGFNNNLIIFCSGCRNN